MCRTTIVRSVLGTAFLGMILFWPAGTLAWPQGWIFLALLVGSSVAIGIWLWKADPGLLAERMKSPLSKDQKPGDRIVMVALMIAFWSWLILAAVDAKRFG